MAANIMEILKQMQRDLADQKEYMRSLNERYNLIEEKLTKLDIKGDQQDIKQHQILESVEKLEQQVKMNNKILFGIDEDEMNIGNKTETSKKIVENSKTDKILSVCSELKQLADMNQSDMRNTKEFVQDIIRKLLGKQMTIQISPTYLTPDQISKLNSELKRIADKYQETNVFSVIEVIPNTADEQPVMKILQKGGFTTQGDYVIQDMAANIMDILKRMQRDLADQKEYMRNLHVINRNLNEKINLMEERTTDLPKVLETIERLEQQVKKNNLVLFGNDETEVLIEGTIVPYKPNFDDKEKVGLLDGQSEKNIEITEVTELVNSSKVVIDGETKLTNKDKGVNNDHSGKPANTTEELKDNISKELEERRQPIKDFNATGHTSIETTCPALCKQNALQMPATYSYADQMSKLNDKLNKITDLYQSDMKDLRESINNFEAVMKTCLKEAVIVTEQESIQTLPTEFSTEQINQINAELKRVTDPHQSETGEIKKLLDNLIALGKDSNKDTKNEQIDKIFHICTELKSIAETNKVEVTVIKEFMKYFVGKLPIEASKVSEQKTVQISPTYFSPEQISKLNSELKRIADIYKGTNMFPIIEVVPGAADEHPVMKQLREGVFYNTRSSDPGRGKIKLGTDGLKRSDVIDMITDYPNLKLYEVVRNWLKSINKWNILSERFNLNMPHIFDTSSKTFVRLPMGQ